MGEKIHSVTETAARSWHFRYEPLGWAIFTVNDATGEFIVVSDWGNYAHRWNINHLGKGLTLLSFIATAGKDYLMDKLTYESPREFKEEVQWDKAKAEIREEIIRRRRDGSIDSKEKARSLWEDADDFCHTGDDGGIEAAFYNCPSDLSEEFEHLSEYLMTAPSRGYVFVRDNLIVDFQEHLKRTVF